MASHSFNMYKSALLLTSLLAGAQAQQVGSSQPEQHPSLSWSTCTEGGSCTSKDGAIVIDSNWRYVIVLAGGS